jgi:fumarate hydratase subunit beta
VSWDDLIAHYRLVKLRVEDLGPLVVGIDAHGGNRFVSLKEQALGRLPRDHGRPQPRRRRAARAPTV